MFRLAVHDEERSEERTLPGESLEIGRSRSCDLVLRHRGEVSRRHFRLRLVDDRCEVEDLRSRHGILLNGEPFHQGPVEVGDEISIGSLRIELLAFGPDEEHLESVLPCPACGAWVSVAERRCPACGKEGVPDTRGRRILRPDQLPGYALERRLGAGGMGVVFAARRLEDDAVCAVKILKPHLSKNPSYLARWVEEVRVLTLLRHEHIVRVYGHGSHEGLTYIDMELVVGESARDLIRRLGRIPERRALEILWQTVRALDHAARQRIVHGDVKPSNLLLDARGAVKLCDFGLARFVDLGLARANALSPEMSNRKGTAAYAAPERLLARAKPTVAGDVYSLGVSLFQMLTGSLPFGTNRFAVQNLDRSAFPRVTDHDAEVRPAVEMLVERMMAPEPERRYGSWAEFQHDLAILLD